MRNFIKIGIVCFFILVIFLTGGCGSNALFDYARQNVSEIRNNLFIGKSENIIVSFSSGEREKNYVIDGKSGENTDFGVFSVIVLNDNKYETKRSFVANINQVDYSGTFEVNPYDKTLLFDIGIKFEDDAQISISVILDEIYETIQLENVSQTWNIDCFDAVEIACKKLQSELKRYIKEKNLTMEIYVKILFDIDNLENPYFWLVTFTGNDEKEVSVVIDVSTGEVLSKKNI